MKYTQEKLDSATNYYKTCNNLKETALKFEMPIETLRCYFYRTNVIEKHKNKKNVKHNIFDNIDNEEKAYWLGYLFGDGSVDDKHKRLNLSSKDTDHLIKFKKFVGSDHKISNFSITFTSSIMVNQLKLLGMFQRKQFSDLIKIPNIDKSLIKYFILGLIDSDGWITKTKHFGVSSSSMVFLTEILEHIKQEVGVVGKTYQRTNHWGKVNTLNFLSSDFKVLYEYFYLNANIFLDRKKNIADNIYSNLKTPKYIWVKKHRKQLVYVFQKGKFRKGFKTLEEAENFREKYLVMS
jgi:hypothetical protein